MRPWAEDQSAVVEAAYQMTNENYSLATCITLLVTDYFITFPREVELIWNAPWTFAKVIFLVNRYTSFFVIVNIISCLVSDPDWCLALYWISAWTFWTGYALAELIFCLRTYAIWEKKRWVVILLTTMYTCIIFTMMGATAKIPPTIRLGTAPLGTHGCHIAAMDESPIYLELISFSLFELAIAGLTLMRAIYQLRGVDRAHSPLLVMLYRDGLLYFVYTAAITFANIVVLSISPTEYLSLQLVSSLQRVLLNILSVRVMLHIRKVKAACEEGEMASRSVPTFSASLTGGNDALTPPL
ncbi:hypothetical protein K439DRAFT_1637709 [Ramaria rubella]|nr:hypothetical protein K439DRAFT_1637709 [Ramaria rubella]